VHVCSKCGLFAVANLEEQKFFCKNCQLYRQKNSQIVQVYLPYACKLFMQELMAMHIIPRLNVDVKKNSANTTLV
jgi:DNA-directed RNA polymerase II subunit RPB2